MDMLLSPEQRALARQAILAGRLTSEEDAVREALRLWEQHEQARADLLSALDEAEESIQNGEGFALGEASVQELASSVKEHGRARLAQLRQQNDAA
jgi:antitoxin ParD1/3/4